MTFCTQCGSKVENDDGDKLRAAQAALQAIRECAEKVRDPKTSIHDAMFGLLSQISELARTALG